jgi:hypothetical protein
MRPLAKKTYHARDMVASRIAGKLGSWAYMFYSKSTIEKGHRDVQAAYMHIECHRFKVFRTPVHWHDIDDYIQ